MAEIPVERKRKSAFPAWLIPLLLLLLLLPLLWFMMRGCSPAAVDNDNKDGNRVLTTSENNAGTIVNNAADRVVNSAVTTGDNSGVNNNNERSRNIGKTVTAVNFFGFTKDKASLVGREVDLRSARVNRVLSDRVFTVKSENDEMFVMLDENLDTAGGKEQQIKIRPGQNVKLNGSFRDVPTEETSDELQHGDLKIKDYEQMKNQNVYLHATSVGNAN